MDVLSRSERREVDLKMSGLTQLRFYSDYIQIRSPVYISHSAGRYAVKRFRKAQCPIIERLTNSLMMNGRNNGKKLMAVRIVAHSFEIVRTHHTHDHDSAIAWNMGEHLRGA
jgi:hypothetical protein